jgi:hypothetical protein
MECGSDPERAAPPAAPGSSGDMAGEIGHVFALEAKQVIAGKSWLI